VGAKFFGRGWLGFGDLTECQVVEFWVVDYELYLYTGGHRISMSMCPPPPDPPTVHLYSIKGYPLHAG